LDLSFSKDSSHCKKLDNGEEKDYNINVVWEEMTKGTEINFSPDIYRCQLENVDEAEEFEVIGLKVTLEEEKVEPQLTKLIFEKKKAR